MATWPSALPAPTMAAYTLAPVDPVIRTDMEFGAPRARRRTAARQDTISVAWSLSDVEMSYFRDFVDLDIDGGAAWFNITLLDGYGGLNAVEARFKSIFNAGLEVDRWRVTGALEIR